MARIFTDFHGFKDTPNRFENVSITLSSSVPFRAIRGSISVFGVNVAATEAQRRWTDTVTQTSPSNCIRPCLQKIVLAWRMHSAALLSTLRAIQQRRFFLHFLPSAERKILAAPPQGQGLGKRWKKRGAESRFHKRYFLWIEVQILSEQDAWNSMVDRLCNPLPVRDTVLRNAGAYRI